jgi:hypothetical protein
MKLLSFMLILLLSFSSLGSNWWDESVTGLHWKFTNEEVKKATKRFRQEIQQMSASIAETNSKIKKVTEQTNAIMMDFNTHKKYLDEQFADQAMRVEVLKSNVLDNELELLKVSSNLKKMENMGSVSEDILKSLPDTTNMLMMLSMDNQQNRHAQVETMFYLSGVSISFLIEKSELLKKSLATTSYNKKMLSMGDFFQVLAQLNVGISERLDEIQSVISKTRVDIEEIWKKINSKWSQL